MRGKPCFYHKNRVSPSKKLSERHIKYFVQKKYRILIHQKIKNLKAQEKRYKVADGGGLFLYISTTGKKYWKIKYYFKRKEKYHSLGEYPLLSLKEARISLHKLKEGLMHGIDITAREEQENFTFQEVCTEWLNTKISEWSEIHYSKQLCRINRYLYSSIGNKDIKTITTQDMLKLLRKIENENKIETAHTILSIASRVFKYAIICEYCTTNPCNDLSGVLKTVKEVPRAAITDPKKVAVLMAQIQSYPRTLLRNALLFGAYTFCKPGEIRKAEWSEIDFEKKEWTIPAEKMKMRKEHRVPLAKQCINLLREMQGLDPKWVFPSPRKGKCISDAAVLASIRSLGYEKHEMCAHGFRAMASTLLNEQGYRPDIIEKALAHGDGDKIRAAYNRAEYFKERQTMMSEWADYLDKISATALKREISNKESNQEKIL